MKALSCRVAGVTSLLIAAAGVTHAEEVTSSFVAPVFQIGSTNVGTGQVVENADGSFTMVGTQSGGDVDRGWQLDWNVTVDYDPFINGSLALTNFATSARNFTLMLDLPVSAFSPSLYGGSLHATVFDDNGDSVASLSPSTATGASPGIYQGTIDGSSVLTLFGIAVSCTGSGPHCSANSSDQDGLPGPTIPGPGANDHIGTVLMFNLSAGDRAVFDTNFTVAPVPLPASAWMLIAALGCMGCLFAARLEAGEPPALANAPKQLASQRYHRPAL